jgi:hypothetical protein
MMSLGSRRGVSTDRNTSGSLPIGVMAWTTPFLKNQPAWTHLDRRRVAHREDGTARHDEEVFVAVHVIVRRYVGVDAEHA